MSPCTLRSSGIGFLTIPVAVITGLAVTTGPAAFAADGAPTVATVLASCRFSALQSAVAAGGTIDYGQDCSSVTFTAALTVPTGLTVTIEADGHSVTFNGNYMVRLFVVTGGTLTIGDISLIQARASTANGAAGGNGGNGTAAPPGQRRQRHRRIPWREGTRASRAARRYGHRGSGWRRGQERRASQGWRAGHHRGNRDPGQ